MLFFLMNCIIIYMSIYFILFFSCFIKCYKSYLHNSKAANTIAPVPLIYLIIRPILLHKLE